MNYPKIVITQAMLDQARVLENSVKVNRTQASQVDALVGILGEFVYAEFAFGNFEANSVGSNKGREDFSGVEVKASAFPFRENLNLLVREDYARRRKPEKYVQIIIDIKLNGEKDIPAGTEAIICGYATSDEVDSAPLKDFGTKFRNNRSGYQCHYIPLSNLHPLTKIEN